MRLARSLFKYAPGIFFLIGSLLLAGCGTNQVSPAPARIVSSQWTLIPPPAGLHMLSYAASPVDPALLYACTLDQSGTGLVYLWQTKDSGEHWSRLPLPQTSGSGCQISIDRAQPRVMTINVTGHNPEPRPCASETFYLSIDGGASWQHAPYTASGPVNPTFSFCALQVAGSHLYLWSSYAPANSQTQVSHLERSDDAGAHWSRIDSALGGASLFYPPRLSQDDRTLSISVLPQKVQPGLSSYSALWMSHDAGQTWRWMGPVPGETALFISHQSGASGIAEAPFYNMSADQLPEALYRERVYRSSNGRTWSALPPVPAPGTNAKQIGLLQALATTDDGRLLAFGVDPGIGIPARLNDSSSSLTSAFWLWIWNSSSTSWQMLAQPLKHPEQEGCGVCWSASISTGADGATYLYAAHLSDVNDANRGYDLFRVRVPVAQ